MRSRRELRTTKITLSKMPFLGSPLPSRSTRNSRPEPVSVQPASRVRSSAEKGAMGSTSGGTAASTADGKRPADACMRREALMHGPPSYTLDFKRTLRQKTDDRCADGKDIATIKIMWSCCSGHDARSPDRMATASRARTVDASMSSKARLHMQDILKKVVTRESLTNCSACRPANPPLSSAQSRT